MSKEIQQEVAEEPRTADNPQVASKSKGRSSSIIILLLFFFFILAASITAWQWYIANNKIKYLQQYFDDKLVEINSSIEKKLLEIDSSEELSKISDEVRTKRKEVDTRFKLLETGLKESINKQKVLEEVYQDLAPGRNESTIEEVEQLLFIANQQLQLANNVKSALAAMKEADVRLQRISHPQILPLKDLLSKDIELLSSVPEVDIISISLSLDNLSEKVNQLPLAMEETSAKSETGNVPHKPQTPDGILGMLQDFLLEIWADIKKLVRIEHVGKQDIPPPSHSYFVRENLKLRLMAAHNALLARDQVNYKAYLKASIEWVNKHFNIKSESGNSMLETLNQLYNNEIVITSPNISKSYNAVRKYRLATKKEAANIIIDSKIAEQKQAEAEAEAQAEREAREKAEEETQAEREAREKAEEEAQAEREAREKAEEEAQAEREAREKAEEEAQAERETREKAEEEAQAERETREKAEEVGKNEEKGSELGGEVGEEADIGIEKQVGGENR